VCRTHARGEHIEEHLVYDAIPNRPPEVPCCSNSTTAVYPAYRCTRQTLSSSSLTWFTPAFVWGWKCTPSHRNCMWIPPCMHDTTINEGVPLQ
jgi:hypothetical protein